MGSCPSKPGESTGVGPPSEKPLDDKPPKAPAPTCLFRIGDLVKRLGTGYGKNGKVIDVFYTAGICSRISVRYSDDTTTTDSPSFYKLLSRESCPFKVGYNVIVKATGEKGYVTDIGFLNELDEEQDRCISVSVRMTSSEIKRFSPSELKLDRIAILKGFRDKIFGSKPYGPEAPPNKMCSKVVRNWLDTRVKDKAKITLAEFQEIENDVVLDDLIACIVFFRSAGETINFDDSTLPESPAPPPPTPPAPPPPPTQATLCEQTYPEVYNLLKSGKYRDQEITDLIKDQTSSVTKDFFRELKFDPKKKTINGVKVQKILVSCHPDKSGSSPEIQTITLILTALKDITATSSASSDFSIDSNQTIGYDGDTYKNTIVSYNLSGGNYCGGVYIASDSSKGYILTAAHCVHNDTFTIDQPEPRQIEGTTTVNEVKRDILGYSRDTTWKDGMIITVELPSRNAFADNIYILENPGDLPDEQTMIAFGKSSLNPEDKKTLSLKRDNIESAFLIFYYERSTVAGQSYYGYKISNPKTDTDAKKFIEYMKNVYLQVCPKAQPGDSGGPVFVSFDNGNKLALVGIIHTQGDFSNIGADDCTAIVSASQFISDFKRLSIPVKYVAYNPARRTFKESEIPEGGKRKTKRRMNRKKRKTQRRK